jgi:hypothetical protein
MSLERCADISRSVGESLFGTATTVTSWLLVEVSGTWPHDVSTGDALPSPARSAADAWLEGTPGSRLLFVRRPGRTGSRVVAFVVHADERRSEVRRLELASVAALASVELGSAGDLVEDPLVLVCGHGVRDACCALRGGAVFSALAPTVPEGSLWISSHQGGHRFAANVLVLPAGLQFGRVEPEEAPGVVASALGGSIELDRYRGRTCFTSAAQAAERAVRAAAGLDRVDDLRLVGIDGDLVRFVARGGVEHAAVVEPHDGPAVPASCGAVAEPQPLLTARLT